MLLIKRLSLGVVYFLLLSLIYTNVLVENYSYQGYKDNSESTFVLIFACAIYLLSLIFIREKLSKPSTVFSWFFSLFILAPTLVASSFHFPGLNIDLMSLWGVLLAVIILFSLIGKVSPPIVRSVFVLNTKTVFFCLTLFALLAYLIFFSSFGLKAPSGLFDVYDTRLAARNVIMDGPPGLGHLLRLFSNVINPLFIIYGLLCRNKRYFFLGVIGQLLIFTFDGTKSTLLSPLLVVGFFLLYRSGQLNFSRFLILLVISVSLLFLLDIIFFYGDPSWPLTHFFTRRFVMVPGHLSALYFEYFQSNEFFGVATFVGGGGNYQGYSSPGFLIGDMIFSNAEGNSNANFIIDGFARAGIFGVGVSFLILTALMFMIDAISRSGSNLIFIFLAVVPAFAAINTGITSLVTTHGVGALFLLAAFIGSSFKHENVS